MLSTVTLQMMSYTVEACQHLMSSLSSVTGTVMFRAVPRKRKEKKEGRGKASRRTDSWTGPSM